MLDGLRIRPIPVTDPISLLAQWIDDAGGSEAVEAIAMCLATADEHGRPSARIVLLRGLDVRGLRFFTSYESRKGRELAENPQAAAVLYWPQLHRQVRVEGDVVPLPENESDEYFSERPRGHRIAAWASEQSRVLESYAVLEDRFAHFDARFEGEDVPRPHSWGGYLLTPSRIEFWQGRPNRMHERIEYTRVGNGWQTARLQP
ncbi:MAG: pyridoxamine 5'-phosphate oxidase [Candidatus Eremiobacteraeota bacterium]|nr:pyridoxamine 5'-phosphate oxidase [Candidatus Eremiobacteraeota bacterium]